MFVVHHHYGQNLILSNYCNINVDRPIFGYMQHSYHSHFPFAGFTKEYVRFYWRYIPLLVYNELNAKSLKNDTKDRFYNVDGVMPISPIITMGAPFLYLLKMIKPNVSLKSNSIQHRKTLAYPFHGNNITEYLYYNEKYANDLLREEGKNVTVCLHPSDWELSQLVDLYKGFGFDVIRHGHSIDSKSFLYNQMNAILQHDRVVSNSPGAATFHAGVLGRNLGFYGEVTPADISLRNSKGGINKQSDHELICNQYKNEMLSVYSDLDSNYIPSERAKEISEHALGMEFIKPPSELIKILGWDFTGTAKSLLFLKAKMALNYYRATLKTD